MIRIRLNCILLWGYLKWDRACKCFTQKKKFICEVNIRRFALLIYVQCMQRSFIRLFEQIQTNCYNNVRSLETSMAFFASWTMMYPIIWNRISICLINSSNDDCSISDNDIRFLVELKINQVEMANNQKYCATLLGNKIKLQIRKKNQAI